MTFKRPATNRNLSFKDIAATTGVREDEVELLVMKALAQGLLKGTIDQVDSTAHFTWVQPRVLDKKQVFIQFNLVPYSVSDDMGFNLVLFILAIVHDDSAGELVQRYWIYGILGRNESSGYSYNVKAPFFWNTIEYLY